ncbi:hypothetical protein TWF718_001543 [Orbilia javanica]|uniref:Uncharacterized protein n=1 Tax=Orbilia javanica TaxID=47235 RepID=A0AAN8P2P4_9PEZI
MHGIALEYTQLMRNQAPEYRDKLTSTVEATAKLSGDQDYTANFTTGEKGPKFLSAPILPGPIFGIID